MKLNRVCFSSLIFLSLALFQDCSGGEEPFECDRNTVATGGKAKSCGISIVTGYSYNGTEEEFRLNMHGGFQVRLLNLEGMLEEGETYTPYELYFSSLNQHIDNKITIIKIDRVNKLFSASYSFENEAVDNGTVYRTKVKGTMTEVPF